MAKGEHTICDLNPKEYQAAIAAIKLVRDNAIKNAYLEGYADGFKQGHAICRNERISGDILSWESSHAKMLYDSKGE